MMKAFTLLTILGAAAADLVQTGASLRLNDVYYFVSPFSQGNPSNGSLNIKSLPRAFGFTPVTVVSDPVPKDSLAALFSNWTAKDDVWQPAFLSAIFLAGATTTCLTKASYDGSNKTQSIVLPLSSGHGIPSGPYFLDTHTGDLYQAFRLYDDFAGAFSESLLQTPEGTFQTLSAQVPSSASLTIGVPSRLYFTPTAEKPLAGVRVGVKDIYALAGVRGSNGNRAWYSLYPPASATGPAIQNLIDAGAVVVGYQKPSQFANGETATADWVDYHAPFNPRGDGYNDPSSSSSGAGASVASYPWLDIAVGSDTGGSIRGPSNVQGLFGNRPSHGLVSLDGVMPLSPTLDTPGFLTRDPYIWDEANKALYGANYTSLAGADVPVEYPKTLYTVDFPTGSGGDSDTPAAQMLNGFARDLAAFLGADLTPFNLSSSWAASAPEAVRNQTLTDVMGLTYATLITKEQTALVRDPFYADYAAAHDGRLPFVNPVPLARWAWGDRQPATALADAKTNKTLFAEWFNTQVLPPAAVGNSTTTTTCSSGLLLYIGSAGFASPRNRYPSSPPGAPPMGFSNGRLSVFSGAPDHVFPLGEVAGPSSVTNHIEVLPVTVDIMAARGCDGLLVRLAQDLVGAGLLKVPEAGGTLAGGEILMRRDVHEWL
ncbi:Putative amidase signature domain-containing protein [Colletotrichum destructivum]|uniref:Amidase signature domain-containing protein n=1 Tax=Colletotrichum destructivum TaxID=34406 RepID=A0AAX4I051_9PEZI|nr:Putative amidase signature domain-containing protein [Colletotrichum destructivum]